MTGQGADRHIVYSELQSPGVSNRAASNRGFTSGHHHGPIPEDAGILDDNVLKQYEGLENSH
jgi:hypothetical protein